MNTSNTNPYDPPSGSSSSGSGVPTARWPSKASPAYAVGLFFSGALLSLPPVPLFFWVADGEPFFGPAYTKDLTLVAFAALTGLAWAVWAGVIVVSVSRRKIGLAWLLAILYAALVGSLSFLTVYLYGSDRNWFG